MNYKETLDYLFNLLPMYQRHGVVAFKKDLKNIISLLDFLDNPQKKFRSIHIAGTNGKGTVTHLIAGSLQAQGLRIGVYTSPHYIDFRERIKINGDYITANYVKKFVKKLSPVMEKIKPSFFEVTVAMAFNYFNDEKVDYAVVETGLGGRLDSTNIVLPEISVITNIGLDHTSMLGNTLQKIASEKAGIIKRKVPVLIGEKQQETMDVFEQVAKDFSAPIYYAQDVIIKKKDSIYTSDKKIINKVTLDIGGPFIEKNLITAIATLNVLEMKGIKIFWNKIEAFLPQIANKTKFMGRWQWLSKNPDILVDSGHNKEGLAPVLNTIQKMGYEHIHFVLGFSADKAVESILPMFPDNATYYYAKANVPRGMGSKALLEKGKEFGMSGKAYTSVRKAFSAARRKQKKNQLIFIGGSIFVIAEVL